MDQPTVSLLDALKHPGAVFLEQLVQRAATEDDLMRFAPDVNQSTGNRKLRRLRELGLAEQESGRKRAPGRRWRATLSDETRELLLAAISLSDAVASKERNERDRARRALEE